MTLCWSVVDSQHVCCVNTYNIEVSAYNVCQLSDWHIYTYTRVHVYIYISVHVCTSMYIYDLQLALTDSKSYALLNNPAACFLHHAYQHFKA